jgi:hypothetical protein
MRATVRWVIFCALLGLEGVWAQGTSPVFNGYWQNEAGNVIEIKGSGEGARDGRLVRVAPNMVGVFHDQDVVIRGIAFSGAHVTFEFLFRDKENPTVEHWAKFESGALAADGRSLTGSFTAFEFQPVADGPAPAVVELAPDGHKESYTYTKLAGLRTFDLAADLRRRKDEFDDLEQKLLAEIKREVGDYDTVQQDCAAKLDRVMGDLQRYGSLQKAIAPDLKTFWDTCAQVKFDDENAMIVKWGAKVALMIAAPETSIFEYLAGEDVGKTVEQIEKWKKRTDKVHTAADKIKGAAARTIGDTIDSRLVQPIAHANEPSHTATKYDTWMTMLKQSQPGALTGGDSTDASVGERTEAILALLKFDPSKQAKIAGDARISAARTVLLAAIKSNLANMGDAMNDIASSFDHLANAADQGLDRLHPERVDQQFRDKQKAFQADQNEVQKEFEDVAAEGTDEEKAELEKLKSDWASWVQDSQAELNYEGKRIGRLYDKASKLRSYLQSRLPVFQGAAEATRNAVGHKLDDYIDHIMPGTVAFFQSLAGYMLSAQDDFQQTLLDD